MNVVITGGTGFIGSHTVETALQRGMNVSCLLRPGRRNLGWLQGLPVDVQAIELTDSDALIPVLREAHYIIHVAGVTKAWNNEQFIRGNVVPTECLLRAALHSRRLRKFCYVSSLTVSGPSPDGVPVDDTTSPGPLNNYGRSKLEAERVCATYADRLPVVVIRPPTVYGPRDQDVLEMFRWVRRGIAPILGREDKTLSLIHAQDLAHALLTVVESDATSGKTYHVSDGTAHRYTELLRIVSNLLDAHPLTLRISNAALYAAAGVTQFFSMVGGRPRVLNTDKAKDLLAPHWVCDSSRFERETGFRASMDVEEGMRLTLEWYRSVGWL